jgi:hypothetical protein
LTDALARKSPPPAVEPAPTPEPEREKVRDSRITTSLTVDRSVMAALKALAFDRGVRVNAVVEEAINNHLALNGRRTAA